LGCLFSSWRCAIIFRFALEGCGDCGNPDLSIFVRKINFVSFLVRSCFLGLSHSLTPKTSHSLGRSILGFVLLKRRAIKKNSLSDYGFRQFRILAHPPMAGGADA
jgi:hypothetical protein